jgi:hypothetical protein
MADKIWQHNPDAYIILEHLAVNTEEKELAEYRADEGKGMMLWGKMTDPYNQLTMGYSENSNISAIYHETRGWSAPRLVGYMESHDEERLMVKNMLYGNATSSYSAKDSLTALSRMRAANILFYTIPGPKMLWQFGELGYDYSINYCSDGTINESCRISPKPVRWGYQHESPRRRLYDHTRDLIRLRKNYDLFTTGTVTMPAGSGLIKQLILRNDPYTATPFTAEEMNAVIVANFDLVATDVTVEFPHSGTWYDYYGKSASFDVTGATTSVSLLPGGYKLFTDVPIESTLITASEEKIENMVSVYPNPVGEKLVVTSANTEVKQVSLFTGYGQRIPLEKMGDGTWDVRHVVAGLFIAEVKTTAGVHRVKIIKK